LEASKFEEKAKNALYRLGHWRVCWLPYPSYPIRGRVVPEKQVIEIYDAGEEAAWETFLHEVLELKLRLVTQPYREMCNALIETIEKLTYARKEQFINDLPKVLKIFEECIEE
jgi:hypothetical protein